MLPAVLVPRNVRRHVSSGCTALTSLVCAPGGTRSLSWIFCSSFDKLRTPTYLTPLTSTRRGPPQPYFLFKSRAGCGLCRGSVRAPPGATNSNDRNVSTLRSADLCTRRDSNPQHLDPKSSALSFELRVQCSEVYYYFKQCSTSIFCQKRI